MYVVRAITNTLHTIVIFFFCSEVVSKKVCKYFWDEIKCPFIIKGKEEKACVTWYNWDDREREKKYSNSKGSFHDYMSLSLLESVNFNFIYIFQEHGKGFKSFLDFPFDSFLSKWDEEI